MSEKLSSFIFKMDKNKCTKFFCEPTFFSGKGRISGLLLFIQNYRMFMKTPWKTVNRGLAQNPASRKNLNIIYKNMPSQCFDSRGNPAYGTAPGKLCQTVWNKHVPNNNTSRNEIDIRREREERERNAKYAQPQAPVDKPQQQSSFFSYLNPLNAVQGVSTALTTANNGLRVGIGAIGQGVGQGVGAIGQGVGAIGQGVYNGTAAVTDAAGLTEHGLNAKLLALRDSLYSNCGVRPDPLLIEESENYENCLKRKREIKRRICPTLSISDLDEIVCDNNNKGCSNADRACNQNFEQSQTTLRTRAVAPSRAVAPIIRGYGGKRTRRNKKSKKSATKKHNKSRSKKSNKKRSTKKKNN